MNFLFFGNWDKVIIMGKIKHHFIPASYLAGFSTELSRKGGLSVFDKKEMKSYKNTCENVGYIKRYYKIDIDGMDEDAVPYVSR